MATIFSQDWDSVAAGTLATTMPGESLAPVSPIAAMATTLASRISLRILGSQFVNVWPIGPASAGSCSSLASPLVWLDLTSGIVYSIFSNNGDGGPINYDAPVAITSALTWQSPPLAAPGVWKFGARATRLADGLEEKNIDAAVTLSLDADGIDVSRRPAAPTGLRAILRPAGAVRVEWGYHATDRPRAPLGFHVYAQEANTGGSEELLYPTAIASLALATVPHVQGRTNYLADLTGLAPNVRHVIGVRAFNASGEEPNTTAVAIVPDATGPGGVDSLLAEPTDTEGV